MKSKKRIKIAAKLDDKVCYDPRVDGYTMTFKGKQIAIPFPEFRFAIETIEELGNSLILSELDSFKVEYER